jgi:hypothetical protein
MSMPRMLQRLKANGELTPDNKVRCNLAEYNKYRRWLRHKGQLEFRQEMVDEVFSTDRHLCLHSSVSVTVTHDYIIQTEY